MRPAGFPGLDGVLGLSGDGSAIELTCPECNGAGFAHHALKRVSTVRVRRDRTRQTDRSPSADWAAWRRLRPSAASAPIAVRIVAAVTTSAGA